MAGTAVPGQWRKLSNLSDSRRKSFCVFSVSARAEVFPPAQKLEKSHGHFFEFYAHLAYSDKTSARASWYLRKLANALPVYLGEVRAGGKTPAQAGTSNRVPERAPAPPRK